MALIEDYRGQADECRRLAETASDPTDKSVWLLLQNAWMRLSDEAPRMLEIDAPSTEAPSPPKARGKRR